MKTSVLFIFCALFLSATASQLPFSETFDTLSLGAVSDGTNGWASTGTAVVQTNEFESGPQALEIASGSVTHDLASDGSSVWVRFSARITAAPTTDPAVTNANTSVAFFVNTNRNLVVYNGTSPVVLSTQMPINTWTRFDVYCDYSNMKWLLNIDGINVIDNLSLYSNNSQVESLLISNESVSAVYFDNLAVQDTEPTSGLADSDGDGIPDWWEMSYFSGVTNASPDTIAANGLSYLQNYIAGLDPDNASDVFTATRGDGRKISWDRKPGRQYDIYWASNLMSGFSFIYTALGTEFEDTDTARLENSAGFYQIRVHK